MTAPDRPTGRVRVTSPLAHAPAHERRSAAQEIEASSTVGAVYVRSLMRAQRRAAVGTAVLATTSIGLLPIIFWTDLALRSWHVGPVPLVWLALGVGVYPWVWLLGRANVARTERNERTFAALMESPTDPREPEVR